MPNYKGHLVGGAVVFAAVAYCVPGSHTLATLFEWLLFSLAGALFPDVDIKSKGQRLTYTLLLMIAGLLVLHQQWYALGFLAVVVCIPLCVRHRGMFHNIWIMSLLTMTGVAFATFLAPAYKLLIMRDAAFFWVGIVSHLFCDRWLFKSLLYPFK